jgi:hypothetical protein
MRVRGPRSCYSFELLQRAPRVVFRGTNLLTSTYLQYNSAGDLAALRVQFNYTFRTIDNVFISYNDTHFTDRVCSQESNQSLVLTMT